MAAMEELVPVGNERELRSLHESCCNGWVYKHSQVLLLLLDVMVRGSVPQLRYRSGPHIPAPCIMHDCLRSLQGCHTQPAAYQFQALCATGESWHHLLPAEPLPTHLFCRHSIVYLVPIPVALHYDTSAPKLDNKRIF